MFSNRTQPTADPLAPWLQAARAELRTRTPPAWLESELRSRWAERRALRQVQATAIAPLRIPVAPPARPGARWRYWLALPVAAAAALWLATSLTLAPVPAPALPAADGPPFIALAPMQAIVAETDRVVVPARLPRSALGDYGLPFDPARADQLARAELLMSTRGNVLAVRFLQ